MGADARLREIASAYSTRTPRHSIDAVARLAEAAGVRFPPRNVVVVGTNGKTSTATFIAKLVRDAGLVDGLTTSPHVVSWGERIRIRGVSLDDDEVADRVGRLHELRRDDDLRFFDLITLAAADAFVDAGVELAVFEAGIGGRLDTTRIVPATVVALTGIALDHVELLGSTEEAILREKLGVAQPGATVMSAKLGADLETVARELVDLQVVASDAATYLERNADLAVAAAAAAGVPGVRVDALTGELVLGRAHRFESDGVEVLLDAAHNPQAWREVKTLLPPAFVAVVAVSADREPAALGEALVGAEAVIATTAWHGRSLAAAELAAVLGSEAVDDPGEAVLAGRERARRAGVPLVVLGSTYLLTHAYRVL
jgi:dihydrofolate synthase/folylpolyglutamate synthase